MTEPEPKRSTGSKQSIDLPIRKAMPASLLVTFALLCLVSLSAVIVLMLKPTVLVPIPVAARRPAPASGYSHDPGLLAPAPTPSAAPVLPAPCEAFAGTKLIMSGDGVLRVREALDRLCRLTGGGVSPELATAFEGLGTASIRIAQFRASDLESTLEPETRTIWLNIRFARRGTPVAEMLPPLIHEAYHLGSGMGFPDSRSEVEARRAELSVCKQIIARNEWPRWCKEAETITSAPLDKALQELEDAGFRES